MNPPNPIPVTGGCYCGAVRFTVDAAPTHSSVCHCANCRRAIGAQSVAWITVPRKSFHFDTLSANRYRTDTGAWRSFCGRCGTSVAYEHDTRPDEIDLTTGSLDHPEAFPPTAEYYQEEKVPWVGPLPPATC